MRLNLWKPEPKRTAGIVRPAVVPGLALSRYSNTELGVRIARRSNLPKQEPAIAWARLMRTSNRPEKDAARDAVLQLCTPEQFPDQLAILTFPASEWRFERALLAMREEKDYWNDRTRIQSIERDIAVYRAACHGVPNGSRLRSRHRIRSHEAPSFASACVSSNTVYRFFCCEFEKYAMTPRGAGENWLFDAGWLDFNGQLTPMRLDAIARFWNCQCLSLLIVTTMTARTSAWMTGLIRGAGGIDRLLAERCLGSRIESVMEYGDGAPMMQVVLRREALEPELLAVARELKRQKEEEKARRAAECQE